MYDNVEFIIIYCVNEKNSADSWSHYARASWDVENTDLSHNIIIDLLYACVCDVIIISAVCALFALIFVQSILCLLLKIHLGMVII